MRRRIKRHYYMLEIYAPVETHIVESNHIALRAALVPWK